MATLRILADLSNSFRHKDEISLHSTAIPNELTDTLNQSFDLEALEKYRNSVLAKNQDVTCEEISDDQYSINDTLTNGTSSSDKTLPNKATQSSSKEECLKGQQLLRKIRDSQELRLKLLDFKLKSSERKRKWDEFDLKLESDLNFVKACQEEAGSKRRALVAQFIENEKQSRLRLRLPIFIPIFFEIEVRLFPELEEDALNLIRRVWDRSAPQSEVFSEEFGIKITRHDLKTLQGLNWLNDEVINFYLSLIVRRSEQRKDLPKTYAFNTFFLTTLQSRGYSAVKRWTRKIDIFSHDVLLIPVHLGNHWCLAVIDLIAKEINYFDSLGGTNQGCLDALENYLKEEHNDKKKSEFDLSDWTFECRRNIPRQLNGSDCGVFTCCFAEFASRQGELKFDQRIMPYYRQRMVYEICQRELMI